MAKAPTIKFPRVHAGFYMVTQNDELRGYIMKEVTDDKETNWYTFDNNDPTMDIATLKPEDAIDSPDELFREAKESARKYFLENPMKVEAQVVEIAPEAEWAESSVESEDEGDWEENTIVLDTDEDGVEFELMSDEDMESILEEELAIA